VGTEDNKTETTDPGTNYSRLENYENPDDIRPYSMLQTDRGHYTNTNIQNHIQYGEGRVVVVVVTYSDIFCLHADTMLWTVSTNRWSAKSVRALPECTSIGAACTGRAADLDMATACDADGINYMQLASVLVDGKAVHTFCADHSCIDNPHTLTLRPPLSGRIVKLTRPSRQYLTMCELQVEGCQSGWWGAKCDEECSSQCDGPCDIGNGDCFSCKGQFTPPLCIACQPGWYGDQCDQQCSEHCLPDNSGKITCGQNNGHCTAGCRSGFYGTQCQAQCGYGCITKICDRQNGACSSCDALWSPPNCAECRDGYYGAETCRPCGHCTNNTVCDNNDGHCPDGCDDGYAGDLCDVKATGNSDTQDGASIVGPIVGSVLGAALLIGLFILLAALIIRRRRSQEVASPPDPSERRTEVQFSTDNAMVSVDAQENKPETSDPESNYAPLENYENPDDIRPYSMLQTNHGRPTNINIQGDEDAVLYHNTGTTGDKTYM
ncbi:hypothetical protein BaRGS_00038660, partial [Batillaria attramentaria]